MEKCDECEEILIEEFHEVTSYFEEGEEFEIEKYKYICPKHGIKVIK